jgi:hypothetical protein
MPAELHARLMQHAADSDLSAGQVVRALVRDSLTASAAQRAEHQSK